MRDYQNFGNLIQFTNYSNIKINSNSIQKKGDDLELKNVRKRTDGRWEYRTTINQKRYSLIKKLKKDLTKEEIKSFISKIKNNVNIINTNFTLLEWMEYWVNTYKNGKVKEKTLKEINKLIKNNIKPYSISKIKIKSLNTDIMQKFLNTFERSRTKELITLYLKAALTKAYKTKRIKNDLFEEIVYEQKLNNIGKPFTYNEQVKILEKLKNSEIEKGIMFFLLTGIRKNELPENKEDLINNINLQNNTIKLFCEKKRNTNYSYKYVDLSNTAIEYITKYSNEIIKFKPEAYYKKFKELLKELKIKGHLHKLRHTFTTNHFYLGNPDKLISSWLGHSTVELTQKVYIYIDRTITKQKILDLYGDLYFIFDPNFDPNFKTFY